MARVEWTSDALDDLQKLDQPIRKRILKKNSWFQDHFQSITPEPLSADLQGAFKIRIGDWRAIYTIESDAIVIQAIGHRREIYKL